MTSFMENAAKGAGNSVVGGIAGALASVAVAYFTPILSFDGNMSLEMMKSAKSDTQLEQRLDLLCQRGFISGDKRCPAKKAAPKSPAGSSPG